MYIKGYLCLLLTKLQIMFTAFRGFVEIEFFLTDSAGTFLLWFCEAL